MSTFEGMGEKLYRCKVCGYTARSGAGLTGHIQLAHGQRASGKEELAQIGKEVAAFREDVVTQLSHLDTAGLQRIASELEELNGHLRALRERRETAPLSTAEVVRPIQGPPTSFLALPQRPAPPPPPSPLETIGAAAVGLLLVAGVATVLNSLFGGSNDQQQR